MSPTSLTTAFLITQIFLLLIVYFGILALRYGEKTFSAFSNNPRPATRNLPSLVFGFSFVTLAPLAFSQDFVLLSQPAFGDVLFPALPRDDAFLIVFLLDIIGAGILMGFTGGAKDSPFSAVLFALPALSIFLRENPTRFFFYTGLAVVLFLIFSRSNSSGNAVLENPKHVLAFQLVTLGCLALSTLVGYATRPL
jgi:hypothetical protein